MWGTVTAWDPPTSLSFTWHPGNGLEAATEVTVEFVPYGERTLVVLEHRGWERLADPIRLREEYRNGWPTVLGAYAATWKAVDEATDPRRSHGSSLYIPRPTA